MPAIQGAIQQMAVQKPRGNDGPVEVERDSRGQLILRLPLEGGGRFVAAVSEQEAKDLVAAFNAVIKK
mgnify:FL=1|jgi:hypothetical protein